MYIFGVSVPESDLVLDRVQSLDSLILPFCDLSRLLVGMRAMQHR